MHTHDVPVVIPAFTPAPAAREDGERSTCSACGERIMYDARFGTPVDGMRWSTLAIFRMAHYLNMCSVNGEHLPADDVHPARVRASIARDRLFLARDALRESGEWSGGTDHGQARFDVDRLELELIARGDWEGVAYTMSDPEPITPEDAAELVAATVAYWGLTVPE